MNKKKFISTAKDVINLEIKALQNLKKKLIILLMRLQKVLQNVNLK